MRKCYDEVEIFNHLIILPLIISDLVHEIRCFKAKSIEQFLDRNYIPLLRWPGNSAHMNPIDNVWECLKRQLIEKERINTVEKLIESYIFYWIYKLKNIALSWNERMNTLHNSSFVKDKLCFDKIPFCYCEFSVKCVI